MAARKPVEKDGSLPLALTQLEDAIYALCAPQSRMVEARVVYVPSLYLQLRDATVGEQVNTGGGGGSKSRPPLWTDAFKILAEIDETIACWQPAFTGVPPTVGRLQTLYGRKWRPQDTRQLEQITKAIQAWVKEINQLLDPEPLVYLYKPETRAEPAACPACDTQRVWRPDPNDPERKVMQPALKITEHGCVCQKCHYRWEPGRLRMLAAAIGYPLPQGVLE